MINGRQPLSRAGAPDRDELIDHMLATVTDDAQVTRRLTAWEVDFAESVAAQWARTKQLSPKQFETLESIYAGKTA